jgi:membrane protein DedA with SNARE-associated domain
VKRGRQRLAPLVARHPGLAVVTLRFAYGLRTAGPAAIAVLGVPPATFALFNAVGALLWATLVGGLGWQFGNALQWWLGDLRSMEEALLAGVLLAGLAYSAWRWWRARQRP